MGLDKLSNTAFTILKDHQTKIKLHYHKHVCTSMV